MGLGVDRLVHELLLEWDEGKALHSTLFFDLRAPRRDGVRLGERAQWTGHTATRVAKDLRRLAGAVPPGSRGVVLASVWVDPERLEDYLRLVHNNVSQRIPDGPQANRTRRAIRQSLRAQRSGERMTGGERETKRKALRRLDPVSPPLVEARVKSDQWSDSNVPGIPVTAMAQASVAVYPATQSYFTPGLVASVSDMDERVFIEPAFRREGGAMLPERYVVGRAAEALLNGSGSVS
jgi:hypothetical protein